MSESDDSDSWEEDNNVAGETVDTAVAVEEDASPPSEDENFVKCFEMFKNCFCANVV